MAEYDELVKRLRTTPIDMRCAKVMREAANAIEELSVKYEKALQDIVKQAEPPKDGT